MSQKHHHYGELPLPRHDETKSFPYKVIEINQSQNQNKFHDHQRFESIQQQHTTNYHHSGSVRTGSVPSILLRSSPIAIVRNNSCKSLSSLPNDSSSNHSTASSLSTKQHNEDEAVQFLKELDDDATVDSDNQVQQQSGTRMGNDEEIFSVLVAQSNLYSKNNSYDQSIIAGNSMKRKKKKNGLAVSLLHAPLLQSAPTHNDDDHNSFLPPPMALEGPLNIDDDIDLRAYEHNSDDNNKAETYHVTSYGSLRESHTRGRHFDGPRSYRERTSAGIVRRMHGQQQQISSSLYTPNPYDCAYSRCDETFSISKLSIQDRIQARQKHKRQEAAAAAEKSVDDEKNNDGDINSNGKSKSNTSPPTSSLSAMLEASQNLKENELLQRSSSSMASSSKQNQKESAIPLSTARPPLPAPPRIAPVKFGMRTSTFSETDTTFASLGGRGNALSTSLTGLEVLMALSGAKSNRNGDSAENNASSGSQLLAKTYSDPCPDEKIISSLFSSIKKDDKLMTKCNTFASPFIGAQSLQPPSCSSLSRQPDLQRHNWIKYSDGTPVVGSLGAAASTAQIHKQQIQLPSYRQQQFRQTDLQQRLKKPPAIHFQQNHFKLDAISNNINHHEHRNVIISGPTHHNPDTEEAFHMDLD